MVNKSLFRKIGIGGFLLILILFLASIPSLFGDYLWFLSVDYSSVFEKKIIYQLLIFVLFSIVTFAFLSLNYWFIVKNVDKMKSYSFDLISFLSLFVVSLFVGLIYSGSWDLLLLYINRVSFGVVDPLYSNDVGFYIFELPFFRVVSGYILFLGFLGLIISLLFYTINFGLEEYEDIIGEGTGQSIDLNFKLLFERLRRYSYIHLSLIFGFLFLGLAGKFYIDRIELVYSTRGTVFGLGATDISIFKPLLMFLILFSIFICILNFLNSRFKKDEIVYFSFISIILIATAGSFIGIIHQSYVVEPDELNKESQYIEREIQMTRNGFGLDRVDSQEIKLDPLTSSDVEQNSETIDNIRLWDHRPLRTVYNEIQSLRTYYTFSGVDTDRYQIENQIRQVMVSSREINVDQLPGRSQSWVNRHLVYTHGFGVTMSPVKDVSNEGLPRLYIKDMPLNYSIPGNSSLDIQQPRIYYGEESDTYKVVNTGTDEFDYPEGDQNVYNSYNGDGGVDLSSSLREIVYSLKFSSPNIFLSNSIKSDSKIQFKRKIRDRAKEIAPFLEYEDNPYIVAANNKLYWILDAYTTSGDYPYSSPTTFKGERQNYIRNSVKVVVDAYSGEINFYIVDDEPIIQAWSQTFPSLFKPIEAMPNEIEDHIRYPKDYFSVQIDTYTDYHMKDPRVFYNKEDEWKIPQEKLRGNTVDMEPYYVTMDLPGNGNNQEFVLIMPFTPTGKQNMIGWLGARSDTLNYGKIKGFQFSKQKLAFGPSQIESRIDQNPNISRDFTLWSQQGSDVFRGNLLAVPIENSILYIEPVYLQSTSQGAIPELKRVVVAQENNLTMKPTIDMGLNTIFRTRIRDTDRPTGTIPPEIRQNLKEARTLYREANKALKNGDFETYGRKIEKLGETLNITNPT